MDPKFTAAVRATFATAGPALTLGVVTRGLMGALLGPPPRRRRRY
jgi:hypothetical protein